MVRRNRGFTLMELLIVLALISLLAGIVGPMISQSIHRSREAALKENLFVMRKAIDDFYADRGAYPGDLQKLVEHRYLRAVPEDPLTERADSWVTENAEDGEGMVDVRSGAEGQDGDGKSYHNW